MARIPTGTLRDWKDADRVDATTYTTEREVLRIAINDTQDQMDALKTNSLIKGERGEQGENAYQVALDNGFVGTEAEWLLSLKGPKGDPGSGATDVEDSTINGNILVNGSEVKVYDDAKVVKTVNGTAPMNGNVDVIVGEGIEDLENRVQDAEDNGEDPSAFWTPPTQPAMPWGENGVPVDKDPELFIQGLYEPLRTDNPDYVTRTSLGKDQSNVWDVWRYELTPKNYTKTIIISAGTHGNEYTGSFSLARFVNHLVNDWKHYPQLAYIRKNVRVIVHPIINPYSFANNIRQNVNGVDINRNFDLFWNNITGTSYQVGGTYYKGTAPFSEKEAQYMRDSFVQFSDSLAYIDFHTINTIQAEHIVFTPRYTPQYRDIFNDTISRLFKTGNRVVNGTTAVPTVAVHAAYTHSMTTANPEWYNGLYGGNRDSVEMTEAVKWYGNVVIKASTLKHKTSTLEESSPFSKVLMYDKGATPATITATVYNNVTHATYEFTAKRHGILKAGGYVKFTLSAPATVGVNPIIYQKYHPEQDYTDVKDEKFNEVLQVLAAGTYIVPLNARFHVFPSNYNEATTSRAEGIKFRLRMKTTAGTVTIDSWRVYLDYTPTDRGRAYEIIDFTGLEAQAEGSDFSVKYPDPTKYGLGTDD